MMMSEDQADASSSVADEQADVIDDLETEVSTDLGPARPAARFATEADRYDTASLSAEQLPVLDADVTFLEQRQDDLAFLEANPLYQGLRAVQAGNVVSVPDYIDAAIEGFGAQQ
jgi:ABC-type Fe2+-enterobactin transport system substrate-binding protein